MSRLRESFYFYLFIYLNRRKREFSMIINADESIVLSVGRNHEGLVDIEKKRRFVDLFLGKRKESNFFMG